MLQLQVHNPDEWYSSGDRIRARVSIRSSSGIFIHSLHLELHGVARARQDSLATNSLDTTQHTFLVQTSEPIVSSEWSANAEDGRFYCSDFIVPDRLLAGTCRCSEMKIQYHDQQHYERHEELLPSYGDRVAAPKSDMAHNYVAVGYTLVAKLKYSTGDNLHVVRDARQTARIRIVPVAILEAEEEGEEEKEPVVVQHTITSGIFNKPLGKLSIEASCSPRILNTARPFMANVCCTLFYTRLDSAKQPQQPPPVIKSVKCKLLATTTWRARNGSAPAFHTTETALGRSSMKLGDRVLVWDSSTAGSSGVHVGSVAIPISMPWSDIDCDRVFVPSFASCLIRQSYEVVVSFGFDHHHGGYKVRVPVELVYNPMSTRYEVAPSAAGAAVAAAPEYTPTDEKKSASAAITA